MRFGLVGTGYWAAETHAPALAAHPDVDFAGVWGRTPRKTEKLAHRYGVTAYHDVDELLGDVAAIAIALPPDIQAALAVRAAVAGRHLLLDKPMALTVAAADALLAEVDRQCVAAIVFFTARFSPSIDRFVRDAAAAGGWDGARSVMFARVFDEGNPYAHSYWRRQKGGLWDVGPHALSIILPVLGTVADVMAVHGPNAATHALLRHHCGAVTTLALTLDAPEAAREVETVFYGEHGRLVVPGADRTAVEAFGAAITELIATAAAPEPAHPLGVHFGAEVVAILAAIERAAEEGATVAV
ncbi:Gfo/Idh/MocA family oxidoreductase [Luedemannella helvata]|uniref:Gfo/Idh/MocA family oxidoreductase n=1 Tax=Luedemannella helvata TaxID=349315 RepID=A0ABP4XBH1_9ACTN